MPGSPEKELPRDADAHMITAGVASVYTSFSFTRSIGSTPERHHARRGDDADELRRTGSASWTTRPGQVETLCALRGRRPRGDRGLDARFPDPRPVLSSNL